MLLCCKIGKLKHYLTKKLSSLHLKHIPQRVNFRLKTCRNYHLYYIIAKMLPLPANGRQIEGGGYNLIEQNEKR